MNESTPASQTPLVFGRYRVKQQVGTGRLATVYHASDERLQRDVLLHVFRKDLMENDQLRQRFVEEINASAQRTHPALLNVFDSGEENSRPFMVTEYVVGRPLSTYGPLTLDHALLYMRQITGAVASCTARGLPHPPISSSNILLVAEGQVKLVENWLVDPKDMAIDLAHYRAPERTEGHPPAVSNVVYALGMLLYELVTGTRPAHGDTAQDIAQSHLNLQIPPLSQVRPLYNLPTLERLLIRSTLRFPDQRLADVAAFSDEIDALWRHLSADTQRLSITPAMPRPQHRPVQPVPQSDARPSSQPGSGSASASDPLSGASTQRQDRIQPMDAAVIKRRSLIHTIAGWLVTMLLVFVVVFGSYSIAGIIVERLFAITLPQPSLADLGITWPEWLPGGEQGDVLVVTIAGNEGLNLRDAPGTTTNVLTTIPNGSLVRKLDDACESLDGTRLQPCVIENVEWVRVRAESADGKPIEGWMSLLYLRETEKSDTR